MPLPLAYRSLPRPSSPPCAQASPTCLLSLDYNCPQASTSLPLPGACCTPRAPHTRSFTRKQLLTSIHRWTKCRRSIRILKSAIYHSFRCQIASTHNRPEQGPRRRRLSIKTEHWDRNVSRRATYGRFSATSGYPGQPTHRSVKEVIQPQVPLRLPCYDFAPVTALAFGRLIPCGFRHGLRALTASMA